MYTRFGIQIQLDRVIVETKAWQGKVLKHKRFHQDGANLQENLQSALDWVAGLADVTPAPATEEQQPDLGGLTR